MGMTPEERFWAKVRRSEGCWEWTGARQPTGYGHFGVNGRTVGAHRFSFELANGPIPAGVYICHSCDNPPCVNPAHLFIGSPTDNVGDMSAKGRARAPGPRRPSRGADRWSAKLSEADVIAIRASYAAGGISQRAIAERYGVRQSSVSRALAGRRWAAVENPH